MTDLEEKVKKFGRDPGSGKQLHEDLTWIKGRSHGQKGTQICDPLANKCP